MNDLIYDAGTKFSKYRRLRESSIAAGNECNNQRTAIHQLNGQLATLEEAYALGKKRKDEIEADEGKAYTDMKSTGRILVGEARDIETVVYLRDVKKFIPDIYCLTMALVAELVNMGFAAQIFPPPQPEEGNPPGEENIQENEDVHVDEEIDAEEDEVSDEDEDDEDYEPLAEDEVDDEMDGDFEDLEEEDEASDEDEDDEDYEPLAEDEVDDEMDGDFEDLEEEDEASSEDSDGSGN